MKDLISCGNDFSCFKRTYEIVHELTLLKDKVLSNIKSGHAVDKRNIKKLVNNFKDFEKEFFSARVVKCLKKNCSDFFPGFQNQLLGTLRLVESMKQMEKKKMDASYLKTIKISIKFLERILKKFKKTYGIIIKEENNFANAELVNMNQNFKNYVAQQQQVKKVNIKQKLTQHILERLSQPERNTRRVGELRILVLRV